MDTVDFEQVLAIFEANGWQLKKIHSNYRVFVDPTGQEPLPWLIPVDERKVSTDYYEKIKRFFEHASRDP